MFLQLTKSTGYLCPFIFIPVGYYFFSPLIYHTEQHNAIKITNDERHVRKRCILCQNPNLKTVLNLKFKYLLYYKNLEIL